MLILSFFSFLSHAMVREFNEGEVWAYRTRPGEMNSSVLINKVDIGADGQRIFHISILDVKIRNARTQSGISTTLPHAPVSEKALKRSLTRRLRKSPPPPDFVKGYETWKAAFDKGDAGVFDVDVADVVDVIETATKRPKNNDTQVSGKRE